ncbi:efflux RND transporter periplasmic adaptor subunit [Desulfovibrio piger]|uniref:efflux RND transporter periplasmic adaptor subunit n=1 Tax=Desulfovibrio piger TaxID=901 RepID=UPI00241D17CD|nr:efflux RND transporter periplasmic adaptor subunit [Desulfovibrio piger]
MNDHSAMRAVSSFSTMASVRRVACTLLACCLVVAGACSRDEGKAKGARAKGPAPVTAAVAVRQDIPVRLKAVGNVEASATVQVRSRITGELTGIHFREGDDVRKGQKLFTIDPRPMEAALREARARQERTRAQLTKAEDDLRRFASLVEGGFVSREQYEQIRTTAEGLRASLREAEAAVESAALQRDYCTITAPADARAGAVGAHIGNMIKANADDWLVTLDTVEPVYVSFSIPEVHLPAVLALRQSGTGRVLARPDGGDEVEGRLDFVDNSVDTATGTIRLRATFDNRTRSLWPGRFVDVRLTLATHKDAVVVPSRAVQAGVDGPYAYAVVDGRAELRNLAVGVQADTMTEVLQGIAPGEKVVVEGLMRLTPGAEVVIRAADAGRNATASSAGGTATEGLATGDNAAPTSAPTSVPTSVPTSAPTGAKAGEARQ